MKLIHLIFAAALFTATGCGVTLEPGDARAFNDDLLYEKIRQHERSLAVKPNERREHNLEMMVLEMKRRYPGWEPESGFPVPIEEARASMGSIPIDPEGCDADRISQLNALGMNDEQIVHVCEESIRRASGHD